VWIVVSATANRWWFSKAPSGLQLELRDFLLGGLVAIPGRFDVSSLSLAVEQTVALVLLAELAVALRRAFRR
jgi:hypothetical protein